MRVVASFHRLLAVGFCALILGCSSDGPPLAEVTGKVTLDGKPVPNAMVTFTPKSPGASYSVGATDAEGNYRLEFSQDKKGAWLGEHEVDIAAKKVYESDDPNAPKPSKVDVVKIPAKYRQKGALIVEVKNQRNTINFELTSK